MNVKKDVCHAWLCSGTKFEVIRVSTLMNRDHIAWIDFNDEDLARHFDEYDVSCQKDWANRSDNDTSLAEISKALTILEGTKIS